MTREEDFAAVAADIDALSERLGDWSLELLREAVRDTAANGGPDDGAAATERVVTRARRALDKASSLLRGTAREELGEGP